MVEQANSLRGRVAVVTGATRGAGRGIAAALGEAGATVICTGRSSRTRPIPSDYKRPATYSRRSCGAAVPPAETSFLCDPRYPVSESLPVDYAKRPPHQRVSSNAAVATNRLPSTRCRRRLYAWILVEADLEFHLDCYGDSVQIRGLELPSRDSLERVVIQQGFPFEYVQANDVSAFVHDTLENNDPRYFGVPR